MNLDGKVVIVTGASSGIGAKTAEAFAENGSKVVLVGRNEPNLKATEAACKAVNGKVELLSIIADITVDAERIIKTTIDKFGRLDVLVNAAGVTKLGNILDISAEEFDWVFNTNLLSPFALIKFAAPHLINTQGNIVNVSGVDSLRAFRNASSYGVSKACLDQLTRCIALDLADQKVRVNAVNPGAIRTEIYLRGGLDNEKYMEHVKSIQPLGRVGEPREVADAIVFLASDRASFINAAVLSIDGGRQAVCPR